MKQLIIFVITALLISSCSSIAKKNHTEKGLVPLLTFVFDDGNDTDYLVAREVFKKQGVTASFAVVTDWISTQNYLTVSQLLELQDDGFEIMSHTVSHPDLKSLNDKKIESELSASKATLEGWGLRVNNLVYPYNKNNGRVRELADKYYRSGRGGRSMMNPAVADRYELKAYSFSHNMPRMKELIDIASAEGKWLILYLHNMDIKVKASQGNGDFKPGEELFFSPSGTRGRYSKELFDWFYFVPLSGTPQSGDTIAGQSSKATCYLDEILYNEKEALTELIVYARSRYPGMRIVTIDKGLDIYNLK
jgi:peptidoglycan/xylan/chitin deacetylase (PgdA/CDA1 family)